MVAIYKVNNITKVFGDHVILRDVSLEIESGEIFGVIGTSGSGKTTLLNTLIGFLRPDKGEVLFRFENLPESKVKGGYKSVHDEPSIIKLNVGFAAQTPSFYDNLTVKENIEFFGALYGLSRSVIKTNTETLINFMDLGDSEHVLGKNISGGMQRRLDFACAMIHDPQILILDEPTADLDPILRAHIWNLIKKINKKGTTIILSSHFLSEIETLCDKIAIIKDGTILDVGTPDSIKTKFSKNEEIHLECFPGNYDELCKFKNKEVLKEIAHMENKGHKLIIYSQKPEKILCELLSNIEKNNETIIDLKVNKPTLDEVFFEIAKNEKIKDDEL